MQQMLSEPLAVENRVKSSEVQQPLAESSEIQTSVACVSLGCSKNQVDAERMLWKVQSAGYSIVEADEADIVIINTCSFIQSAKEEAIDTILEFAEYKAQGKIKKIIVTGCLAQRYKEEVSELLPEVDAVIGLSKNDDILNVIRQVESETIVDFDDKPFSLTGERLLFNAAYSAYLKIADGCDNNCTYCAIPSIRGKYRSVPMNELLKEAESLAKKGVTELILVAQDTTMYGKDFGEENLLPQLLEKLCEIDGFHWIRILYTYPERITDELLDVMAKNDKIVKYLDMPIQHCNDEILKKMNRRSDKKSLENIIEKIRNKMPDITLRTTLITGFPGETEEQFTELAEFVKEQKFDRLGCFPYSQEENTAAADFENQIDDDIKQRRAELISDTQSIIAERKNSEKLNTSIEVLTENYDPIEKIYCGRSKADAPEIDCKVYFKSKEKIGIGQYVIVKIVDVMEYDLIAATE
jgi:ribosomal protein S12 methylthiotransferase